MEAQRKVHRALKIIKWVLPRVEKIIPSLAKKIYIDLFFRPRKSKYLNHEKKNINKAEKLTLWINNKKVFYYKWGSGKKVVLFVHGWEGRAGQGSHLADKFLDDGHTFYAVDLPAHGQSSSKQTNILECAKVIGKINQLIGKIDLAIAHSFGGAVLSYALSSGVKVDKSVLIGTPHDLQFVMDTYQKNIGASNEVIKSLHKYMEERLSVKWQDINPIKLYSGLDNSKILMIHDVDDKEVPFSLAKKAHQKFPNIKLYKTEGLGHKRILKNHDVIDKCARF